jgi:superfamily II DNA or RNA helicase
MATKGNKSDSDSDTETLKIRVGGRDRGVDSRPTTPRARSMSRSLDVDSDYDSDIESGKKPRKNIASPSSNEPVSAKASTSPKKDIPASPKKKAEPSSSNSEAPVVSKKTPVSPKKKAEPSSSNSEAPVVSKKKKPAKSASSEEVKKKNTSKKKKQDKSASSSFSEEVKKKKTSKKKKQDKSASSSSSSEDSSSKKKKTTKKKPKKEVDEEQLLENYTMKIDKRKEPFTLVKVQEKHVARMIEILKENKFALDNSKLGSGKTITAMALIMRFLNGDLNPEGYTKKPKYVVYITYSRLIAKVQALFNQFGFKNTCVLSFEGIRSNTVKEKNGKILSHGLLSRQDYGVDKKPDRFAVTEMFQQMVERGCLLFLDEVQALTNTSLQYYAAKKLERHIIDGNNPSYVVEMTGSEVDDMDQLLRVMYRFGLSKEDSLYTAQFGNYEAKGITEVIKKAKEYDRDKTVEILAEEGISSKGKGLDKDNTKNIGYKLFKGVIQNHISHSMPEPKPEKEGIVTTVTNTIFRSSEEDNKLIAAEIKSLVKGTKFNSKTGNFDETDGKKLLTALSNGMKRIETSKTNIFIRKAKDILKANDNAKLVIALNNKFNIKNIAKALKKYGVLIIWGKDPDTNKVFKGSDRQLLVDKFNREDNKYRVLIGVMKIISTGFDLDDKSKDGSHPRSALASPIHSRDDAFQFTGRFIRGYNTSSSTKVDFVYADVQNSKGENVEMKVLNSMAKKKTKKAPKKEKKEDDTVSPGGYPEVEEEGEEDIPDGPLDVAEILESIGENDETDDEDEAIRIAKEQEEGEDSDDGKKKKSKKKPAKKPSKKKASSPDANKKKSRKKKNNSPSESSRSLDSFGKISDSDSD